MFLFRCLLQFSVPVSALGYCAMIKKRFAYSLHHHKSQVLPSAHKGWFLICTVAVALSWTSLLRPGMRCRMHMIYAWTPLFYRHVPIEPIDTCTLNNLVSSQRLKSGDGPAKDRCGKSQNSSESCIHYALCVCMPELRKSLLFWQYCIQAASAWYYPGSLKAAFVTAREEAKRESHRIGRLRTEHTTNWTRSDIMAYHVYSYGIKSLPCRQASW